MKKKARDSDSTDHGACPKKQGLPRTRREACEAEAADAANADAANADAANADAANVRYFLHALNQMSLALRALGYAAEGTALVKVKADLDNRLFRSPDKLAGLDRLLH